MKTYTDAQFLARAEEEYPIDGEIEFDDDAQVSRTYQSDPGHNPAGAYVQGWVWVEFPEEQCTSKATLVDGTFLCDLPEGHEGGHKYTRTCQRGA
jgi:hypothetical protein